MKKTSNFKAHPETQTFKVSDSQRQKFQIKKPSFLNTRPIITFKARSMGGHR